MGILSIRIRALPDAFSEIDDGLHTFFLPIECYRPESAIAANKPNIMKILNSLTWLIAISLFSSCSKEENEPQLFFPPESESFVTNGMTFPTEGGRQSFTFTPINQTFWYSTLSNEDDQKWCEVNYVYDFEKGQDVVANINVLENPELYERSTTLTIEVGDMQKQILIKQEKK